MVCSRYLLSPQTNKPFCCPAQGLSGSAFRLGWDQSLAFFGRLKKIHLGDEKEGEQWVTEKREQ